MKFYTILRKVAFKNLWAIFKLSCRHPLFVYPTYQATKECLTIATEHYGRLHYQNTPANAFRHAFWNYLIAKKCTKWSKNKELILNWTKDITNWHEEIFKNSFIAKKMDLHNNHIGRSLFKIHNEKTLDIVIEILLEMTKNSIKITELPLYKKQQLSLVHLID